MYEDVVEIREVNARSVNDLLGQGWKLLETKTIVSKVYRETVCLQRGIFSADKYQPVYDEVEKIVYIVGKPKKTFSQ